MHKNYKRLAGIIFAMFLFPLASQAGSPDLFSKVDEARLSAEDIREGKTEPSIGMTKQDVIDKTNYGKPNKVKTVTSSNGTTEIWYYYAHEIYDRSIKAIHFNDGVISLIEE